MLRNSSLGRLLKQLGIEINGLPSKYKSFNMDRKLKSMGKDLMDNLLYASDKITNELGK